MTTTEFYINKLAMTLFLVISLPFQSLAEVWQDPMTKVNYEYTVGESEASVKSSTQNTEGTLVAGSPDVTGHVVIREKFTVDGTDYTVTSIGQGAFRNITDMTGVTIPESVVVIGIAAFYGCTGLTSINIPSSVTEIDSNAFMRCTGLASVFKHAHRNGSGCHWDFFQVWVS